MRRLPEALSDCRFSGPRIRDIVTKINMLEHDVPQLVLSSSSRSLAIHYGLILNSSLAKYIKISASTSKHIY